MPPTTVFVDVDTQRDFLDPGGALFVPGSTEIRANLAKLSEFARTHAIPVIATACDHDPDDEEFAVFPPHCVRGTAGRLRVPETERTDGAVLPLDRAHAPEGPPALHLTIAKRRYDVFHRPEAGGVFDRYAREFGPDFVVYGVATDYCVKAAVEGLLARGHAVRLVVDAVRAVDRAGEADVLSNLVRKGAVLTLAEAVFRDERSRLDIHAR